MEKREALEICRDLWDWLAKSTKHSKDDWPGWQWNGGKVPALNSDCPLCHLYRDEDCNQCPLFDIWGQDRRCDDLPAPFADYCTAGDSPYWQWEETHERRYARKIRDAAIAKLKELEEA